ncbi:MAG TPA: ABC transporter permease [Puia sp.]|jgi:ABC-type antimicrobial peptide transport system permease subunit
MFKHHIQLLFRTYRRYKSTFVINLIGLSTGLACALLIYLWISDELGFDKFHRNDSRLYQVMVNERQGDRINTSDGTNGLFGEIVKKDLPEVEYAVTTTPSNWFRKFNITYGNSTVGATGNFAGKDYFNVFSYALLQGSKNSVLADKSSIVLSRDLAMKLFNTTENVVGKTIQWKWATITKLVTVTGIFSNFPSNSTYQFDFVVSLDSWKDIISPGGDNGASGPTVGPFTTFLVLREHTDVRAFNEKLANFSDVKLYKTSATLFLRKYSDGYLHGKYENGVLAGGRIEYVRLFSIIASFILLIACINFMNLSTAKVTGRMKEVGLRKALGAGRRTLIFQFMGESVLMSLLALGVALVLVGVFLPQFNGITGKHFTLGVVAGHAVPIVCIALATGLIAGCYPAFYLSGFKPVLMLKGKLSISSGVKELLVRKGLVVLQFTLSLIFIVSVIVVYKQIKLVQNKSLGYDKDHVIYFEMEGNVPTHLEAFLSGLGRVPGVVRTSSIMNSIVLPAFAPQAGGGVSWDGKNKDGLIRFYGMPVNYDLIETLGIKMAAGRTFSRQFPADSAAVILNETAIKVMGISDPIGKVIKVYGHEKRIIGVTQDFHFNSLHSAIKPFMFGLEPGSTLLVMARLAGGKEGETIGGIRKFYRAFNPGFSFDYQFLDYDYQKQYASEKLVATLSWYFAGLAILLSCLGLFGLAAFTAERRSREIGMRKILGASEYNIIYLLSADFARIVLLSIVIGLPLSYWMTRSWLDNYAYRIDLSPLYFIGAALVSLVTALLAIGVQIVRSSLIDPIAALKEV